MDADLTGRVAVVMGATRGIGRAIVLKYVQCGAQVVFQGRDEEAAAEVIRSAGKLGHAPKFVAADFDSYDEIRNVVDSAVAEHGQLDILVANGGARTVPVEPFAQTRAADLTAFFTTRLYNKLYMIHSAIPHMQTRGYGKIVATTSDAGRLPTPGEALVGASASALIFLTRALGKEFARLGIRINAISTTLTADTPGYDWYRQRTQENGDAVVVKAFRKLEDKVPFGLNRPEDLAELALFLASRESDRISGAVISINGGISFPG